MMSVSGPGGTTYKGEAVCISYSADCCVVHVSDWIVYYVVKGMWCWLSMLGCGCGHPRPREFTVLCCPTLVLGLRHESVRMH